MGSPEQALEIATRENERLRAELATARHRAEQLANALAHIEAMANGTRYAFPGPNEELPNRSPRAAGHDGAPASVDG